VTSSPLRVCNEIKKNPENILAGSNCRRNLIPALKG
jgi:hypothetical protein